jgi:uncharacterized protein DUF4175
MRSPDDLRSLLAAVRRRWRAQAGLRGTGRAVAIFAVPLAAAAIVARLLPLGDGALTFLLGSAVVLGLIGVGLVLRSIPRSPSDRQIARFIEERVGMDDELVSAVDASGPGAGAFHAFVVDRAAQRLEQVGATAIVPSEALRRAGIESLAGIAALAVAVAVVWPFLGRAAESTWIALFPQSVRVVVVPGDVRVVAGKPVTIRAWVLAGSRPLTRFTPRVTLSVGKEERAVSMSQDPDGRFQLVLESIDRSFHYRVTAGSARSQDYSVTAMFPPHVTQIDLRYEYPSFAKLDPREEANGGDIYAPAGTKVRVRIHTDKPIASGELALGAASTATLQPTGVQTLEGDLVLAKDGSYRVGLLDRDGLRSAGETEYFIRVMDDRPPDVRILRPGGDEQITPLEEVAIEARAEDDYGVSQFELVFAVAGRAPVVVPFTRTAGTDIAKVGTHVLQAENLGVQPGDVITYYARARDVARGKRSTVASSDMYFLEVRPFSEEFVSAQSQAGGGMADEQIEALISAQKEIINATWNIERRASSGAGRSTSDIGALASAQLELKARAEQMSPGIGSNRGPFRPPQQLAPQGGTIPGRLRSARPAADPVGAAISAMGRAIDQLNGQRTNDALPHEMAALQGLLQAQAEIRRREVMQQAGSGMSGSGRQGQDLSALFDKELQRQQRTNYETKTPIEQTPQRPTNESALDKIRDLAKRQEDLSRRQRELAKAGLPPEEMKRQLEKLTREQEELRQQTEELTRQMAQQQRGSSGQQGGGQGASGLRDATEQMRSAANELQRQSPGSAADRSEQAAAGLRKFEQQMREGSSDAKQRAAGELRLEAQQIADEQRRIASEAERLEKGSGASNPSSNNDALRRLAGEKEKLADRVDALQRGSEGLAKGSSGTKPGTGPGAAAKEIQRERIAERMRESAGQMRGTDGAQAASGGRTTKPAAPAPKLADTEQQIARALDRVVNQLGDQSGDQQGARAGASEGDAQQLARQLDQAKGIRDGLDRLERQLREAEAKGASTGSGRGQTGTDSDVQRLREEYAKAAQSARATLSRLEREQSGGEGGGTSPEEHEWSVTDQGKEAFKQDFSQWQSLKKDVDSALDRYEASVVAKAARRSLDDRLSAGGSDRVPDAYRRLIARYYESLARKK